MIKNLTTISARTFGVELEVYVKSVQDLSDAINAEGVQCAEEQYNHVGLLFGPYRTHEAALADVEAAKTEANKRDGRAWFYSYGTCKRENGHRDGSFNNTFSPDGWNGESISERE